MKSVAADQIKRACQNYWGGGQGGPPPPPPPPAMTCGFLIQLVLCKKNLKKLWFIGVEVEQETSAPPPKKKILDPSLQ